MSTPIAMANKAFRTLLLTLVGVFVFILVALNVLLHFVVIRPVRRLSTMADRVSKGDLETEEITLTGGDEVAALSGSFNRMRISLVTALKMLENE
jgi:protein-histidine pros-kinase